MNLITELRKKCVTHTQSLAVNQIHDAYDYGYFIEPHVQGIREILGNEHPLSVKYFNMLRDSDYMGFYLEQKQCG